TQNLSAPMITAQSVFLLPRWRIVDPLLHPDVSEPLLCNQFCRLARLAPHQRPIFPVCQDLIAITQRPQNIRTFLVDESVSRSALPAFVPKASHHHLRSPLSISNSRLLFSSRFRLFWWLDHRSKAGHRKCLVNQMADGLRAVRKVRLLPAPIVDLGDEIVIDP